MNRGAIMLTLKFCINCGNKIPKAIKIDRFYCCAGCHKRYIKKYGDPRPTARDCYVKEYDEATVARHEAEDPEFAASIQYDIKRPKTAKCRKRGGRQNPQL